MNDNFCHPSRQNKSGTCFIKSELQLLKDNWNRKNPQKKIIKNENLRNQLLYKSNCNNDICLQQKYGTELHENKLFRPQQNEDWIKNPVEWLSTYDIEKCLHQYEEAYPEFLFFGATPIDICQKNTFNEKVLGKLCDIYLPDILKKGYTKIGVVFNTDPHDKPGQHWFSCFMDLEKGQLFLFDSNGIHSNSNSNSNSNSIEKLTTQSISSLYDPVVKALQKIQKQGNQLYQQKRFPSIIKNPFSIYFNKQKHQRTNSECGMYSIYFIVRMIEGSDFKQINSQPIPDKFVFQFRNIFFRPITQYSNKKKVFEKKGGNLTLEHIVDPSSLQKYKIHSERGIQLLRHYLQTYLQS